MNRVDDRLLDGLPADPRPVGPGDRPGWWIRAGRREHCAGRRGRRGSGRRWTAVLTALTVIVGVGGAGTWLVLHRTTSSWSRQVTRLDSPFSAAASRPVPEAAAAGALNILVLGSDRRVSAKDPTQWAAGGQRTDAIMIVHVTSDRTGAFVMSIPRDSWVEVPGHGRAKINAAFSWGGPRLIGQTVEQLTGVRLDHFALVDFEGFKQITDALGGVPITVPRTVSSAGQGTVRAGTYTMDGETALTYVRQRYNVPGDDLGRVKRQQNWIRAMMIKLKAVNPVTDPMTVNAAVSALSAATEVDDGFTPELMQALAKDVQHMGPHDVRFFTVPVAGTGWSPDRTQSIVKLNTAVDAELWAAIRQDRIADWVVKRKPDNLGHTVR
jgi:LCP family protein required for cell wall assembly